MTFEKTMVIELSFVLLTWNSERYIRKCLEALLADMAENQLTYEVYVIDNGSQDRTTSILREFQTLRPKQIIPIFLEKNTGTTYSRNLALKQAKGIYICIMDSDVEITPGAIKALSDTLKDKANVGLVAPKLVYPNGTLQKSTDAFPTILTKVLRYFFLKAIEKRENMRQPADGLREVDYAISAMWMLKREVLERVGLLDEKIFYAPEDVDYCFRIWKAGYQILYNPSVSCVHHTQEISRGLKINRATVNHICGLLYYFRKHQYFFKPPRNIGAKQD